MASVQPGSPASADAPPLLNAILNRIEVAICLFDAADRVLLWNDAYLRYFPEEADILKPGLPYVETLRRFFEANLTDEEAEGLDLQLEADRKSKRLNSSD